MEKSGLEGRFEGMKAKITQTGIQRHEGVISIELRDLTRSQVIILREALWESARKLSLAGEMAKDLDRDLVGANIEGFLPMD